MRISQSFGVPSFFTLLALACSGQVQAGGLALYGGSIDNAALSNAGRADLVVHVEAAADDRGIADAAGQLVAQPARGAPAVEVAVRREQHHGERIDHDRHQHVVKTKIPYRAATQYSRERRGTTGRMDAAEIMHGSDGETHRTGGSPRRIVNAACAEHPD